MVISSERVKLSSVTNNSTVLHFFAERNQNNLISTFFSIGQIMDTCSTIEKLIKMILLFHSGVKTTSQKSKKNHVVHSPMLKYHHRMYSVVKHESEFTVVYVINIRD